MIRSFSTSVRLLTPVEHTIHFWRIRFVVDNAAIDFDPSVGLERHLLRTDDHPSGYTVPFQKARYGRRSLQAKSLFPIPDASHVYSGADLLDGMRRWSFVGDRIAANSVIQPGEIPSHQIEIEMKQLQVRLQHEK